MGWAKERAEELSARGYGETGDLAICPDCILDDALRTETTEYLTCPGCSFCGRGAVDGEAVAADFEDFMRLVMAAITYVYRHANDEGVPRDEGAWVIRTYDSDDVVDDVCAGAVGDDVLDAIKACVPPEDWTERNFELLRPDLAMRLGWSEFCDRVKHKQRFVFLAEEEPEWSMPDEFTSEQILRRLVDVIRRNDLLREVAEGTVFHRGRMVPAPADCTFGCTGLASPPVAKATANRFSPAGISMFYGCADEATVIAEIAAFSTERYACIGSFETARPLMLVDLTALPDVPSLFDSKRRDRVYELTFLRDFADELSKPVRHDGAEHIEYVPTQVVTEYLRWIPLVPIDGLAYTSAQNGGTCVVIFADADACTDTGAEDELTMLRMVTDSRRCRRVVAVAAP